MSKGLSPNETVEGITLNEDGTFKFRIFKGMKYLITFETENKKGKEFSKSIVIDTDNYSTFLEIILESKKE